jgi:hypothetical protein
MDNKNVMIRDLVKEMVSNLVTNKGPHYTIGYIETVLIDLARYSISDDRKDSVIEALNLYKNGAK